MREGKTVGLSSYQMPPPPPPPPNFKKRSLKPLAIGIVVLLAFAGVGGAYYFGVLQKSSGDDLEPYSSPSVSPSPSIISTTSSPTASPHATLSTSSPSSSATTKPPEQGASGYRLGAWANYTTENYDFNEEVTARYNMRYSVDEEFRNGVDCWILQTETVLVSDEDSMKNTATYWLDKRDLHGIHFKIQIYSKGEIISTVENDYSPGDFNDIPTSIDPTTIVSHESITVPAGTFSCEKAAVTTKDLGKTYVVTVWGNSGIPIIGMVKEEMTQDGFLISSTELVAYGG
jgi:hypothetical protein